MMKRKLKMGMIGGGAGAFIGDVHRKAALLDGMIDLVCGAFSSSPEKSKQSGTDLFLPSERCYGSFGEMIEMEKKLPEGERMDFVSVVTPNHLHFAPSKLALENGFHVICDKPLTHNLEDALELQRVVDKSGLVFSLTHNYTAYPMVKQGKAMIKAGLLGKIRKVVVQYHQGWLSENIEESGQKQASWRTNPEFSGIGGSLGDIGTHAHNLAEYMVGADICEVAADVNIFVENRCLDDDANMLVRFSNGAKGSISVSQIAAGEENNLNIQIYGEKGGIEWRQEEPNSLWLKWLDKPKEIYRSASFGISQDAQNVCRVPAGHPEGYLECFASTYKAFAEKVYAYQKGDNMLRDDLPGIAEGVKGMKFIYAAVESGKKNSTWVTIK